MAAYQYEIEYPRSAEHANADALSRLFSSADARLDVDEYLISYVNELPVTVRASATRKDPVLARVYDFHITQMAFSSCRSCVTAIFFP